MKFNVRIIPKGARYGLTGSLVADADMVEFYDPRFANTKSFGSDGQFVARYYAGTLANHVGGLCLDGGVPAWNVTAEQMTEVRALIAGL